MVATLYFFILIQCSIVLSSLISFFVRNRYITYFSTLFCVFLLTIFYGLRDINMYTPDGFTTDTYRYALVWFPEMKTLKDLFFGEVSWKGDYVFFFIPYIVNKITGNPSVYLYINCLISLGILFYFYFKLLNLRSNFYLYPFSILAICVTSSFVANYGNLLRQGLAISFFVGTIYLMANKQEKRGWFFLFLAFMCHKSIIMFFPVFLLVMNKKSDLKLYIILLILFIPFIKINFFSLVLKIIPIEFITKKFEIYKSSYSFMLYIKVVLVILVALLIYFFRNKFRRVSSNFDFVFKTYVLILIGILITFHYNTISERLLFFSSILIPYFLTLSILFVKQKFLYQLILILGSILYGFFIFENSATYQAFSFNNLFGSL